jgi:acetate CoA/acetoacetate CoA-transferase beta subunit
MHAAVDVDKAGEPVVTDMAVIAFSDGKATLLEIAPNVSVAEVVAVTDAELVIPDTVPELKI